MEQYFLGIECGKLTSCVLINENKKVCAAALSRKNDADEAVKECLNIISSKMSEPFAILGIGICGKNRMDVSRQSEIRLNSLFALCRSAEHCGMNYIVTKNTVIKTSGGVPSDIFCIGEWRGDFPQKSLRITPRNKKFYASLGAALAAMKTVYNNNAALFKDNSFSQNMQFKTLNCNGCKEHCVLSALIFNNEIKACFGAKCGKSDIIKQLSAAQ